MVPHNSEFTRKLRAAVRAKIEEFGIDVDDELPDYVMIMVGNKKDKMRMKTDLKLFLGDKTSDFVEWLFGFFQKVKNATATSSTAVQQQQPKKQDTAEGTTEKQRTPGEQTVDRGDGGGKAAEKEATTRESSTKSDRQGKTRESEKPLNGPKIGSSQSRDEEQRRHSRSKVRQSSSSAPRGISRPDKNRPSPSLPQNRSPPRNEKIPHHRSRISPVKKNGKKDMKKMQQKHGVQKKQIGRKEAQNWSQSEKNGPKTGGKGRHNFMISPERKTVVLPSKGAPALRSVVSVPAQFVPTAHPRVRPVARSPSPLSSSFLGGSSPKVLLSDGIVPVMEPTVPLPTNQAKIVNQLDIAIAASTNGGSCLKEAKQKEEAGKVEPRKQQQVIRTIRTVSPPPKSVLSQNAPPKLMDAVSVKAPRRSVIFGGGSLIFQRAIQQQQQKMTTTALLPQKTLPKATVVVRPQIRMVTMSSPSVLQQHIDEIDEEANEVTTTKRPTQRRTVAEVAAQQQAGAASLFQRAIKETKRQRKEVEEMEGIGTKTKRISTEMVQHEEEHDEADVGMRKRPRIEVEPEQKQQMKEEEKERRVEKEEQTEGNERAGKEKQQQKQREEEVLTIDMSKDTRRKREIKRPPKFALELVKEHISAGKIVAKDGHAVEEEKKEEQSEGVEQKHSPEPIIDQGEEITEDGQRTDESEEQKDDRVERSDKVSPERTIHFKRNWAPNSSATTSAPIWDGRIEIDDMSSTDDEAEIDAVLADAQRLRKLALQRELPPTASMSRPLLYNPLSLSTESGLISPSDAALLPAVSYKQLMMLSGGGGGFLPAEQQKQQQSNNVNGTGTFVASSAAVVGVFTAATCDLVASEEAQQMAQQPQQQRPHATVAPTTTIQAAPATMIVQQQYHYHHQTQQLRPFSHPYSHGYVPSPVPTFRYQVNRGSMSKVYMAAESKKTQFAIQQPQSVAMGDKESLKQQRLQLLREQHTKKSQALQRQLEEQRLLLGQLQKMPSAECEQRKELLNRVRQMDPPISQLKRELNEISEQITSAAKCDG